MSRPPALRRFLLWVAVVASVGWVVFAVGSHFYETADASAAGGHS